MTSDRCDGDAGLAGGEASQVAGIMCEDHATTEADRCRDDKRIDCQFAASARRSEKVTGDSGGAPPVVTTCAKPRARTESMAASVPPPRYNSTSTADGTRTGKFLWWALRSAAHELMTLQILVWTCEGGQRFAVQN